MPKYIHGYVAAPLNVSGINLDEPLVEGFKFEQSEYGKILKQVEEMMKGVAYRERVWTSHIAIKDGVPVYAMGLVIEEGQRAPTLPSKLTALFPNKTATAMLLRYQPEA